MKNQKAITTYNISEAAERMRKLRELKKLKQNEVAALLGIDRKSLGAIEHGRKGCSVDTFIGMSELYDVSLDYLIKGKDTDGKVLTEHLDRMIACLQAYRDTL